MSQETETTFTNDLAKAFDYSFKPTHIMVNPKMMELLATLSPGGGNSRQRRRWRRMWTYRSKEH